MCSVDQFQAKVGGVRDEQPISIVYQTVHNRAFGLVTTEKLSDGFGLMAGLVATTLA